ncbi:MAG: glycine/sarcosine/betaine reductase selenoprotein B family protein [Pseudomonadota bacterium]
MDYVRYIDRTSEYYISQGYEKSYQWAQYDDVPFTPLSKPLSESRVALLSTSEIAVRFDPETEDDPIVEEGFRDIYTIPADVEVSRLYSRTASFDSYATHLDDVNTFFPVDAMRDAVARGRIGSVPPRFYGAYNNYSQRKVLEEEAPKVLRFCREDEVDVAVMVPV